MSYNYQTQRAELFSDLGQRLLLGVRDHVHNILKSSGAITMSKAAVLPQGIGAADHWTLMACVDRLAEIGEILELTGDNYHEPVFVLKRRTPVTAYFRP